jgi:hypothetical protein
VVVFVGEHATVPLNSRSRVGRPFLKTCSNVAEVSKSLDESLDQTSVIVNVRLNKGRSATTRLRPAASAFSSHCFALFPAGSLFVGAYMHTRRCGRRITSCCSKLYAKSWCLIELGRRGTTSHNNRFKTLANIAQVGTSKHKHLPGNGRTNKPCCWRGRKENTVPGYCIDFREDKCREMIMRWILELINCNNRKKVE